MHFDATSSPRANIFLHPRSISPTKKTLGILLTRGWSGIRDIWDRAVWTL